MGLIISFLGCADQKPSPEQDHETRSDTANADPQSESIPSRKSQSPRTISEHAASSNKNTSSKQSKHRDLLPEKEFKATMQRTDDPPLDRKRLNALGIKVLESQGLTLIYDGNPTEKQKTYEQLPSIVEELIKRFQTEFILLPRDVRLKGFVMRDRSLFLQSGLLPDDFADVWHGINKDASFWMNDQPTAYYRRHLLIHEAVHCLMDFQQHHFPVWYLEGMAEFFAIHEIGAQETIQFGIPPGDEQIKGGFGRLQLIRDEIEAGRFQTISQIKELNFNNFYPHKTSYAWSWALCHFLATHPESKDQFLQLMKYRSTQQFQHQLEEICPPDDAQWNADWAVFVASLVPDYDIQRSRISWNGSVSQSNPDSAKKQVEIQSETNWQQTKIRLTKGTKYWIKASGRYSVSQKPIPWECEPQGVSVEYVDGQPLGQLQAVLFTPQQPGPHRDHGFLHIISVGRELILAPKTDCELFFRVNDLASGWKNNKGEVSITVEKR